MQGRWITLLTAVLLLTPAGIVAAQGEDDPEFADLEIDEVTISPDDLAPGEDATFSAVIENTGEMNATGFNVSFFVDGEIHDTVRVDGLDAGDETTVESAPWNATEGEHVLKVIADVDDEIMEADQDNNADDESFEVEAPEPEFPDLEVDDLEADPDDPAPGENVTFVADIENSGDADAGAFNVTFEINGEEHDTVHVDGLGADNETRVESAAWNATEGEHTIRVIVDSADEVEESDEANNAEEEDLEVAVDDEDEADDEDDERRGPPGDAEQRREDAEERREERREAGSQWDRVNASFEGRHVSFELDEALPGILNYTIGEDTLVASVQLDTGDELEWKAHGRTFKLETGETELRAFDNPTALLLVEGDEDATATLVLADGVNATLVAHEADDDDDDDEDEDERRVYELSFGENRTAWLSGDGLSFDNGTFTIEDRAHLRVFPADGSPNRGPGSLPDAARSDDDDDDDDDGPPEHARGRSEARAASAQERGRIEQASAAGAIGVEVHGDADEGEPVAFELGHVSVRNVSVDKSGDRKASLSIEAPDGAPGTTVVLNLDAEDLGNLTVAEAAEKLEIRFDNETIAAADDLEDALDWANDDGEAEYLLLVGGDKVQVLVSVPHFSPHTIEVYEVETQSTGEDVEQNDTPFPAVLAMLGAALAAAAIVGRKD